ncbi:hypothetical protein GGTG_03580 [Gaeumannomyces tritici R3-111a-1]|uniref:Uncharacterized protein n=1 Tax=Gaeumannomyces tritici (strain R3-111a-1) TaxID=644352 RepID=J3NQM4_GAET3|nr:hypothetical protein GGTG_03580 [Gaeumannomyces tritici R3-111a-1]EJT78480.1 hypothetical protein GGTG_03580 [Gaeumannomyces tritici R3-111a-1]
MEERKRARDKKKREEAAQRRVAEKKRIRRLAVERVLTEAKRRIHEERQRRENDGENDGKRDGERESEEEQETEDDLANPTPSSTTLEDDRGALDEEYRIATDEEIVEAQTAVRSQNLLATRSDIKAHLDKMGLRASEKRLKRLTYSGEVALRTDRLLRENIARQKGEMNGVVRRVTDLANENAWFKIKILRLHLGFQEEEIEAARQRGDGKTVEDLEVLKVFTAAEVEHAEMMSSGTAPLGRGIIQLVPMFDKDAEKGAVGWALGAQDRPDLELLIKKRLRWIKTTTESCYID